MNYFQHLLIRLKTRKIEPTGFIDAGAHFGETNGMIKSVYPNTRVVSFEANPNCEPILKQKGLEFFICLLGDKTVEKVEFFLDPKDPVSTGCSIYKENTEHFAKANVIEIPMYRLDDIIPENSKMDFLKMDVQGAELKILDGATKLLPSIKWIYLEVSFVEWNLGAPKFGEVFDYLRSKGFEITDMCDPTWLDNKLIQCNYLFERA